MNPDFDDFLRALSEAGVRFLVAGAHALAIYGVTRSTGDIDIWIEASPGNAERAWQALRAFGVQVESLGIAIDDLSKPNVVVQVGLPPRRIDILTGLSGLTFEDAWKDRVLHPFGSGQVPFISRESLVVNKRETGRLKDMADLEALGESM